MKRTISELLLLILFIATVTLNCHAEPTFQRTARLFNDNALVSGEYTGFCHDFDGFLWIGTDGGLIRFDGNSYDIYRHDDKKAGSLSDSRVLGLMCDSKGKVWVATANGLNLYEPSTDTFRVITLPGKDFYGYIISMDEQRDGTVTFIVSGVGFYIISEQKGEPVAVRFLPETPFEKEMNSIVCTPSGRIYLGCHNGSVFSVADNGNISIIPVTDSYIQKLALEDDGNVLIASTTDIYRLNPADDSVSKLSDDGFHHITCLSNQSKGNVYVGTSADGLWTVKCGSTEVTAATDIYCPFVNLHTSKIGAAYAAPDGNLWLGCDYYGVVMVPGRQIPFLYRKLVDTFPDFGGGLSAMAIWNGNLLAGLDKGRVALFAPDGRLLMSTAVPSGGSITSINVADNSHAYVGVANEGVWELDLSTGRMNRIVDIAGKFPSVVVAEGLGDDMFIGIHGAGLLKYDRRTRSREWIPYNPDGRFLTNPFITFMHRTPDDKIWIGLYGGLACYDLEADSLVEINQEPFLSGATFAVAPDTDGRLLVGTSHGLIHFTPGDGIERKFTTADGLTDNDVRSIVVDANGGKWIGTMRGLSYQEPDSDKILAYHGGYGLVETSFHHMLYSPGDNRIYLGSNLGITAFEPDSVPAPGFDHEIKLSALYLNGQRLAPSVRLNDIDLIDGPAMKPDHLNLPYKDNALTLRLSTMDFRDASNMSYMWRLKSSDPWMETSPGENLIYLPHMEPGEYDLEILAMENNVASSPTTVSIIISTPWYMSGIAKMLYVLVIMAFLELAWLLLKKKREEKINDAKIKFFIDVSHDIRSPMTLILSPLESLLKQPFEPDVKVKLQTMHRNAQRILSLVNQLLDIRKVDKGKMRLSCRRTNLNEFVGELVDMFQSQAAEKQQTLSCESLAELPDMWLDRDNFDKILVNLISNAIKYTPEGGHIDVRVGKVDDERLGSCASVSITDTGIGLDRKTEAKIFERFYRVREDHASGIDGFGIGLDLCRRLVELHHGQISAHNRTDGVKGSVFEVLLPLDADAYGPEELVAVDKAETSGTAKHIIMQPIQKELRPRKVSAPWRRVLLVDDDDELRAYLESQLGKGYKVRAAANGNEAVKIIGDWMPDVIVSDVMMPEMDGLSLLKLLKSNADTHHIPVLLLSSKSAVADRMAGWDKGADAYLGKPFNIDELEAVLETLIGNRLRVKGKFSGAQDTEGKIEAPDVKSNDDVLLERIMKAINENIDDSNLNVERLSMEVGVSRAHLHRKMKELIGMSPSDYIRTIRLRRACDLLKTTDIEITQVAYALGFTSQSHFSTHFKRFTGYSPSEFRAKNTSEPRPDTPDATMP